jgi:hypothetical protein
MVVGCDRNRFPETKAPKTAAEKPADTVTPAIESRLFTPPPTDPKTSAQTSKQLKLDIKEDFLDHETTGRMFFQTKSVNSDSNSHLFQVAPSEQRIHIYGKLYSNVTKENYSRFPGGGEVSLKLKFE